MSDVCPKCGQPKNVNSSGRLTQWVNQCMCDVIGDAQDVSISFCQTCGKRINEGRKGSLTQFVFRTEFCRCDRPKPIDRGGDNYVPEHAFEGFLDSDDNEEEISVETDSFPLDRYKPIEILGEGAAGEVYLARDRLLGKKVAVKTLHQLSNEQLIAFQNEAKATSLLNHPNIVQIMDFGITESSTPFMVLQFIPGNSLESELKAKQKLPWKFTVKIFLQILDALKYAHAEGIFHRDIKPSNIIFNVNEERDLTVKLIDFGIAQIEQIGQDEFDSQGNTLVGTPHYMSPDQAKGMSYGTSSEIYSIGCVLFECLTGKPPFSSESSLELIRMHAQDPIPKIFDNPKLLEQADSTPEDLEKIIEKCLNKNPDDRYQKIEDLANALENLKSPQEKESTPVEEKKRIKKFPFVHLVLLLMLTGALAFVLVADLAKSKKKAVVESEKKKKKQKKKALDDVVMMKLGKPRLSKNNTFLTQQYGEIYARDLESLDLSKVDAVEFDYCEIKENKVFEIIGNLPLLERIILPGCRGITSKSVEALVRSYKENSSPKKNLSTIDYVSTDIEPGSIKHLNSLKELWLLELDKTTINDDDLKSIKNLNIKNLTIENTEITDKGLLQLANNKFLRQICIENTKITSSGREKFKKLSPKCKLNTWRKVRNRRSFN